MTMLVIHFSIRDLYNNKGLNKDVSCSIQLNSQQLSSSQSENLYLQSLLEISDISFPKENTSV